MPQSPQTAIRIMIAQEQPSDDVERNLDVLAGRITGGTGDLLILPENVLFWGRQESIAQVARDLSEWTDRLARWLQPLGIPAVFGGIPVRNPHGITNSSLVIAPDGSLLARYDKIHLFQLFHEALASPVDETQAYTPGAWQPTVFELKGWRFGLSICYDLRFPELFREYAGADAIICTAAFTRHTGRAHWDLLVRARAVENQCYLIAAGACGTNCVTGAELWGHSMVVDAWGRTVSAAGDEPALLCADLDHASTAAVRAKLPALRSRRR